VTFKCRENPGSIALSRLGVIAAPLTVALGIAAALILASCGGSQDAQLLSGATAREITANLDTVERLANEGECVGAEDAAEQVSAQVEALRGVDETLKRALQRGATRLNEVVATCEEATTEALAPARVPQTDESTTEAGTKQEEKRAEKERKEAEKEEAKEEPETGPTGPPAEVPPPHSNGEGKGPPEGGEPTEGPSGGIGPGAAVGEGD